MAKDEPLLEVKENQVLLAVRRFAPFKTFGGGFEGDGRGFDASRNVTYRTAGLVRIDLSTGELSDPKGSSSGTAHDWLGRAKAEVHAHITSHQVLESGRYTFRLVTAGGNPLVPMSPDIDTYVDLTLASKDGVLRITGAVHGDPFPYAEVLIRDHRGSGYLVFKYKSPHGRYEGPFTRLYGASESNKLGLISSGVLLDGSAAFVGCVGL